MVLMASSLDEEHPGANALDGSDRTHWISTGLYPQELLVQLCHPAWVSSMLVASTHVRQLRIEGCHEQQPVNFQMITDGNLLDAKGELQIKKLACLQQDRPLRYIRLLILSGWHDFCSVHRLQVHASKPNQAEMAFVDSNVGLRDPGIEGPFSSPRRCNDSIKNTSKQEVKMVKRTNRLSKRVLTVEIPTHPMQDPNEVDAPRIIHPAPWRQDYDINSPG